MRSSSTVLIVSSARSSSTVEAAPSPDEGESRSARPYDSSLGLADHRPRWPVECTFDCARRRDEGAALPREPLRCRGTHTRMIPRNNAGQFARPLASHTTTAPERVVILHGALSGAAARTKGHEARRLEGKPVRSQQLALWKQAGRWCQPCSSPCWCFPWPGVPWAATLALHVNQQTPRTPVRTPLRSGWRPQHRLPRVPVSSAAPVAWGLCTAPR